MESATLEPPGWASCSGGSRDYKKGSKVLSPSSQELVVQRPLNGCLAKSIGHSKSTSPAFHERLLLKSLRPSFFRQPCMRPLHAIYRHGRLENVESVFVGEILLEGATSEAQDDLDALSELYLASGTWENGGATVILENTQDLPPLHGRVGQPLDLKFEDVLAHGKEHAVLGERAHSHCAASTSGASKSFVSIERKQSMRDPLREKQKYVAHLLSKRGLEYSGPDREALSEGQELGSHHESLGNRQGGHGPSTQTAKSWHEAIASEHPYDSGRRRVEQEHSAGRGVPSSRHLGRKREVAMTVKEKEGRPFEGVRAEASQQHPGVRSTEQQWHPQRHYGYSTVEGPTRASQSVRKMRQKQSQEGSERAQGQTERVGQPTQGMATAETKGRDESDTLQGLFLGRAGWTAVLGGILQWTERLTRMLSSLATKSLPRSMPRKAIEHALNGALAIGVIWVCKAALQVALTLAATLCCLFIISRVFWDLSVSSADSEPSQARTAAGETDQRSFKQESETEWRNKARSRRESSSGGSPDTERIFRRGSSSRYSEDVKNRQRSSIKSPGIASLLRQQAEFVGDKARSFVAQVVGSDIDVLQMFDMSPLKGA